MRAISTFVYDFVNFEHCMHYLWHALSNKGNRISKIIEFRCLDYYVRLTRAVHMDRIGKATISISRTAYNLVRGVHFARVAWGLCLLTRAT